MKTGKLALQEMLDSSKRIVVVSHRNPDGDAIGSSLAMVKWLNNKGHRAVYVSPNGFAEFYKWLPGLADAVRHEERKQLAEQLISTADIIFCLDFNTLSRIDLLEAHVKNSKAFKVLIDHHLQPDTFAQYMLSDTHASSTGELVYRFIHEFEEKPSIDVDMAVNLYAAILTDTGSFRFNSTTPHVHQMAAHLLEIGVKPDEVYNKIYNTYSEQRLKFYGYCISQKLKVLANGKVAYFAISLQEQNDYQLEEGGTEGLVNYALMMADVEMAALFKEASDRIKISFRSKDEFDVNQFARTNFNGGGHKNAAGGQSKLGLNETVQQFENIINNTSNL